MSFRILINLFLNQTFQWKSYTKNCLEILNACAQQIGCWVSHYPRRWKLNNWYFWLLQYIVLCAFPNFLEEPGYFRLDGTVSVISQKITTFRQGTSWYEISGSICCSSMHKHQISKIISTEAYEICIKLFALFVGEKWLLIFKEDFKL